MLHFLSNETIMNEKQINIEEASSSKANVERSQDKDLHSIQISNFEIRLKIKKDEILRCFPILMMGVMPH